MQAMLYTLIAFTAVGLLFVLLGLPLALRRIGPNWWYGLRVPQTVNDCRLWYAANAYCGTHLILAGLILGAVTNLFYLIPLVDVVYYTLICAATTMLSSFSVVGGCSLFLRRAVRN
jgi:uncharacterized membrane protein